MGIQLSPAPLRSETFLTIAILKQQLAASGSNTDDLAARLESIPRLLPFQSKIQAWNSVHLSMARLQANASDLILRTSSLRLQNLPQPDRAAIRSSTSRDFAALLAKLETLRARYESAMKGPSQSALPRRFTGDIQSSRDEIESKYKRCEQGGSSDYLVLITIIKSIDQELAAFNQSMS